MNKHLIQKFQDLWQRFMGEVELPLVFYYTDNPATDIKIAEKPKGWRCFVGDLAKVRKGQSLAFSDDTISCGGGKRYLGYSSKPRPGFEYFLSCGNADIEGERYKQSPELVEEFLRNSPVTNFSGKYIVFKRWDKLTGDESPDVAIFFAKPDVLSALFTLSNFDRKDLHGVIAPFGSGCASIIQYPLAESAQKAPRTIMGMFDISARPYIPENTFTLAMPIKRLETIIDYMEESFLITPTWDQVKKRVEKT